MPFKLKVFRLLQCKFLKKLTLIITVVIPVHGIAETTQNAYELLSGALELMRGESSYLEMEMHIQRDSWARTSRLVAWSRGEKDSLVRFVAPAKDAGNATLKKGDKMWTYTPKLNRTIRLPYSMMSQSWAGSDFSYDDMSRSDRLLEYYELTILDVARDEGFKVYRIEAIPLDGAPVVWGKEEIVLREDYVLLSQTYFDQDMEPLKKMVAIEISDLGGRIMSTRMRMYNIESPNQYTEIRYMNAKWNQRIEDNFFTVFALQSGSTP